MKLGIDVMIRVPNTKTVICSKKELKMLCDCGAFKASYWGEPCVYELPLFSIKPDRVLDVSKVEAEYVLVRTIDAKLTDSFFDKINKTWNKLYED